jgi:hypothetical protein
MWTGLIVAPRFVEEISSAPRDFDHSRQPRLPRRTRIGDRFPGPEASLARPLLDFTGPDDFDFFPRRTDLADVPENRQPISHLVALQCVVALECVVALRCLRFYLLFARLTWPLTGRLKTMRLMKPHHPTRVHAGL